MAYEGDFLATNQPGNSNSDIVPLLFHLGDLYHQPPDAVAGADCHNDYLELVSNIPTPKTTVEDIIKIEPENQDAWDGNERVTETVQARTVRQLLDRIDRFENIDENRKALVALGPVALPQLILSERQPALSKVARIAISEILQNSNVDQLIAMKGRSERISLVQNGTTDAQSREERAWVHRYLRLAVSDALRGQLKGPPWLQSMHMPTMPSLEIVRLWDQMATPEGMRLAAHQMSEVARLLDSRLLNQEERDALADQLLILSVVTDPTEIDESRKEYRKRLINSDALDGASPLAKQLYLELWKMGSEVDRSEIEREIYLKNIDLDPDFIRRFKHMGGDPERFRQRRNAPA